MQYSLFIDQVHTVEWGLSLSEAAVFSFIAGATGWAATEIIDGKHYRFLSRNKVLTELPAISDKPDTIYRIFKALSAKGVISYVKHKGRDFVLLTAKGLAWGRKNSEKNPDSQAHENDFGENSEIFPESSEINPDSPPENSETIPTYQKTSSIPKSSNELEKYIYIQFERLFEIIPRKDNYQKAEKLFFAACKGHDKTHVDHITQSVLDVIIENQAHWLELVNDPKRRNFSKTLAGVLVEKPWDAPLAPVNDDPAYDLGVFAGEPVRISLSDAFDFIGFTRWNQRKSEGDSHELERPLHDIEGAKALSAGCL